MSNSENDGSAVLRFYCRDCETTFQSKPDGTGYEQAPCPACGDICMTVQFEQEEQQRHRNESTLFSFIGFLTGWSSINGREPTDTIPPDAQEPKDELRSLSNPITVCTFENVSEANTCCALLDQLGVDGQLIHTEGTNPFVPSAADGVILQVASTDVERAKEIIDEYRSVKTQTSSSARKQDGHITFECEDCGTEVTFPTHRQGGVEVCPHCGEYLDVPD